jgi:hypothetical protein
LKELMSQSILPTRIVHADWSVQAAKRQMAVAWLQPDGSYIAHGPTPIHTPERLLPELSAAIGPTGCALVGFDFPIGVPDAYAQKTGIDRFPNALPGFGHDEWSCFYQPAQTPEDISLFRPFYPARPGQARQSHLLHALGMDHMDQLRRTCELGYPGRRAAAPLFWTLGGQQVGKAAMHGWQKVLTPALLEHPSIIRIWPFDGSLRCLLVPGVIVVAETYPAEFYQHLKIAFNTRKRGTLSGKRSHRDRQANAGILTQAAEELHIKMSSELRTTIHAGFGSAPHGEDAFDAFVGLLGMAMVVRKKLPEADNFEKPLSSVEGWIFGQAARSSISEL